MFVHVQYAETVALYCLQQRFSTYGTRVIGDTDQIILTLRLYFYATLLTQRYKENDTQADKSHYGRTFIIVSYSNRFKIFLLTIRVHQICGIFRM